MENGLISIGKMAEMSRLSVAALRLYDELGLLKPYLERYLTADGTGRFAEEANAILGRLAGIQPVPAGLIGPDSLYKEFI